MSLVYARPAGAIYAIASNVSISGYTSFGYNTVKGEVRHVCYFLKMHHRFVGKRFIGWAGHNRMP